MTEYSYRILETDWILYYMTNDNSKTKAQLLDEIAQLRKQIGSDPSRMLFENAPLPYQSLDGEGKILDVNAAWLELLGYKKEKVIGRFMGEFLTPDSTKLLKERFCAFLAKGEVRQADFTMIKRDGSRVLVMVNGRIGYDELGNFRQTHCILHDVTDQRKNDSELSTSEQRFRGLFESSLDGIMYVDTFGSILNVNPAFCAMLGSTSDELLGKNAFDITPRKWHEIESEIFHDKIMRDGYSDEFEKEYLHNDGHLVPVTVHTWLDRNDEGTPIGSWSVVRDLTSQKAAEKVAAKSEQRYQLLAENAEDVIWTADTEFNYTYVSPSTFRLRGFTPEEVVAGPVKESMTPESYCRTMAVCQETLEAEARGVKDDVRRIEVELICKDGSTLWAEVIAKVMRDKSGKRIGYTGMTRDISDRKKAEQKLREGEDSLRALLDATADNVGLFSLDGTILTVNQNMADAMGHTIKEMLGQNIFRYFPRKMAKERKASFDMAVESKVPQFMKDVRSGRIIDSAIYPLLGESGEVTTLAVYAKDVTDAILAEQAQKQSEKQYRRIVETVNEGIIGFDADQRITYANQITADFLGYEIEEIVGSSYYDVLLPEDLDDHKKRVERQSRGKRERYERCFLRKDGEIVWGLVSATPILAEDGRHLGSFAMIADITETKKSEKLIRKSEERYRRIIETANEGVLQIGTDSVVQFVNKRMCDMLGYTTIELHGSVVAKLLFPEDVGALTELLERREQWLSGHYEQRLRHKDGHEVWTQVSASAIFGDDGLYQGTLGMVTDITERRQAEAALKLTQFSVDNASIDIYWINADGRFIYANNHACESLGYTLEEMLTLTVPDINPYFLPEDWPKYWLERKQHGIKQFETVHQRKDGSELPVGITSHYWKYEDQEYLFSYIYDLSERKQAEEKLRRSQELLNEVQRISQTGGWEVDMVTGETHWTDGQFQLHGLEPGAIPSDIKRFFEFYVHPADRASLAKGWQKVVSERVPVELEYRSIKADGTEAVFVGVAIPDVDGDGTVRRVFGSTRDVTMERRAAQDITQAHERLLTILDGIDADIYVSDLETHEVLFMNAHMKEHFGSPSDTIPCHVVFRDEPEPCTFCAKPKLLDEFGNPVETMINERYNPLTKRWYLNHDRAIEWLEGKKVHMHMAADVTELKTMADDLKLAMGEAQAASIAKNEFLANMSHEIRTPLNGLLGMLQLLQLTSLVEEQRDYLDTAVDSGRNLLHILNDILDLSKIESGKLELDEYAFELGEVIDSVVAVFRRQAESRGLTMFWKIDESLHRHFMGDKGRLRQILFNLVGNAAKFTESGTIVVEAYPLKTRLKSGRTLLYFTVADTGIGIPDDKLDQVFDPFTQVDGSFTRKYQGTGLGLGIVRRLVRLMEGTISILSQEGKGTSVSFTIAVTPEKQGKKAVAIVQKSLGSKGLSILVAEDERVNREVVQRLLTKLGYTPLCVENGEAALEMLKYRTFDCVLMDIQMPELDGLETTRAIREELGLDVPVIALTAHAMKGDRKRFIKAGMNGYVAKPFDIAELQKEIERVSIKPVT